MEKLRPLLIILFVLCTSCRKEILNKHDFVGLWIEKGKIGGCAIEFSSFKCKKIYEPTSKEITKYPNNFF